MRPDAEGLSRIRRVLMGVTGLFCLSYAILALVLGRPDPLPWFLPGGMGAVVAGLIAVMAILAGQAQARVATDELHRHVAQQAQSIGYWVALGLYPVFGLALWQGWCSFPVAFAAMGTLTAAAYLLAFFVLDAGS